MARWWTLTSVSLTLLLLSGRADAQPGPAEGYAQPAGWDSSGGGGYAPASHYESAYGVSKAKSRSYGPMAPLPSGPGRIIYEELPDDQGWLYEDTPLERMLKNTFRHAYFRVDYLNWSVDRPGNNLVGSDTAIIGLDQITLGGRTNDPSTNDFAYPNFPSQGYPYIFQPYLNDPEIPFQISNPGTGNNTLISVVQPSLRDVDIDNNNGMRLTYGLPNFSWGTLEGSVFALQTSTSQVTRSPNLQFDIWDSNQNGIFGETLGNGVLEIGRDGGTDASQVVRDFQAFASPILIDMQVPTLGQTGSPLLQYPIDPILGTPVLPPITNPLSPGTELTPDPTDDPTATQVIPGRNDNFRIVWDLAYDAQIRTQIWGSEANAVLNPLDAGSLLSIRPLMGFRYVSFRESFSQRGAYTYQQADPRDPANATLTTRSNRAIDASTLNNLYGPQLGMRAELNSKWLTVGVQPKAMLGLNSYKATLDTQNVLRPDAVLVANQNAVTAADRAALRALLGPDDIDQTLRQNESTFGVAADLEVFTKLHLTENLSLNVGYNLMWLGMITRPGDNVTYNARTVQTPNGDGTVDYRYDSDFKLDVDYSGAMIQGLNVGAELSY